MEKVTGIEIEVGGKKILLSEEEARKLHSDLDKLFGHSTINPWIIRYRDYEPIRYPEIVWSDHTSADPLPPFPTTTC